MELAPPPPISMSTSQKPQFSLAYLATPVVFFKPGNKFLCVLFI